MTLSNLLAPNLSKFHNLVIFICHLFTDGQFRTGHILYDPGAFQVDRFMIEIQSICTRSIPWLLNDVTKPIELPWKPEERTDHILQLVLFDPDNLPKNIEDFKILLTFYRFFTFSVSSINGAELNNLEKFPESFFSNSLNLIHYTSANDSVCIYWIHKNDESNERSVDTIHEQNHDMPKNLFSTVFDTYEKNWLITIKLYMLTTCTSNENIKGITEIWNGSPFFANFYFRNFNSTFIDLVKLSCQDQNKDIAIASHELVRIKNERKFYKELTTEYEHIEDGQM